MPDESERDEAIDATEGVDVVEAAPEVATNDEPIESIVRAFFDIYSKRIHSLRGVGCRESADDFS